MANRISYEKQMRDRAAKEGKILVTVDLNAKIIKKGAFCIQGAFYEADIDEVKLAFTKLLEIMSGEKLTDGGKG